MKKIHLTIIICLFCIGIFAQQNINHFIFTSDLHYGLIKDKFRNQFNVSATTVNLAMVNEMNKLPYSILPKDKGVAANDSIKNIQAVIVTGDIANRQEKDIPSASQSWLDFQQAYTNNLTIKKENGQPIDQYLLAGNHDVSNTIGYHKPMQPLTDNKPYIAMYNSTMHPITLKTKANFNYQADKIHYSINTAGVHMQFINLWPDSAELVWMEKDLQSVTNSTPVILFAHSIPDVEARFFINPNDDHSINGKDKFENLLSETFKDGNSIEDKALIEQRAFVQFLKKHTNVKAYFHGHNNHTEFYTWNGPDNNIQLTCFRVDSPMKGKVSSKDETKLSFELISIDSDKKLLTVRECLWNSNPSFTNTPLEWRANVTISLQ
jgi:hypothetical protein